MFLSNNDLENVAHAVQPSFEVGSLHSRSSIWQIFPIVQEELMDMGYPQSVYERKSLVLSICKVAQAMWNGKIVVTKMAHDNQSPPP